MIRNACQMGLGNVHLQSGRCVLIFWIMFLVLINPIVSAGASEKSARDIIKSAIETYRGEKSYSEAEMIIHRPTWERSMAMKVWTEGVDKSLVRVVSPKKDAGNGNLLVDGKMWSYSPKINRVIKIPSSMSQQSWMGSDFSNNDIARADDLIDRYEHKLIATEKHEGKVVYVIESIPHDDAPVVWGKEIVKIRSDNVILEHSLYDQEGVLAKVLKTEEVRNISGRSVATIQRMRRVDVENEWTEIRLKKIDFNISLSSNMFTLTRLRNPQ